MARPIILRPKVCLALYKRVGSLRGVQQALQDAGVISPYAKNGRFAIRAIQAAILEADPSLVSVLGENVKTAAANLAMTKLEKQLGLR